MVAALRFLLNATRGYRLRPWRSPYLRWRMETYTGQHAETIGAKDMVRFLGREGRQFLRFLRWTGQVKNVSRR